MSNPHVLVLGAGSVGKRHLRNFNDLGCQVSAMDVNPERLQEASAIVPIVHQYQSMSEVAQTLDIFDGVIVASPPKFHCQQAITCIQASLPVLMEKPAGLSLSDVQTLHALLKKTPEARLLLGYTYRWWPPLNNFKQQLTKVGKPLHAKFIMSAHLADWHPWEAYQDFFMASSELGGGALLDESHFLDLMLYFFGMPHSLYGNIDKSSTLEISSDDNVDIIVRYETGLRVVIHLDLYGRPHEKYISVTGEQGTIEWSFDPNQIRYSRQMSGEWETSSYEYERNYMFIELAKDFLQLMHSNTFEHALLNDVTSTMALIEACRMSSRDKKEVIISDFIGN